MDSRLASTDRGLMVRTWRGDTREEEGGGEGHLAVVQLELLPGGEAGGQAGDGDPVRVQHLHALAAPRPLPAWRLEVSHLHLHSAYPLVPLALIQSCEPEGRHCLCVLGCHVIARWRNGLLKIKFLNFDTIFGEGTFEHLLLNERLITRLFIIVSSVSVNQQQL